MKASQTNLSLCLSFSLMFTAVTLTEAQAESPAPVAVPTTTETPAPIKTPETAPVRAVPRKELQKHRAKLAKTCPENGSKLATKLAGKECVEEAKTDAIGGAKAQPPAENPQAPVTATPDTSNVTLP